MNVLTVLCAGGWMPRHLSEGWRRMGWTVHEFLYGSHMGKSWAHEGLSANRDINRSLLDTAKTLKAESRLDLIFAVIYDDVLEVKTARALSELGVPLVNYHVDLVGQWYRVLRTGAFFDRVACAQRDHWRALRRAGIRTFYMPMAANPVLATRTPEEISSFSGVTYLGSPWAYRREVLSAIHSAGIPLRVYGHNWLAASATGNRTPDPSKTQPLRKNLHDVAHYLVPRLREEGIQGIFESLKLRVPNRDHSPQSERSSYLMGSYKQEEFVSLVRGSAINLGFTHFRGRRSTERRQVRLREFEIPMAGGFYLTQDCEQLRELFEVGRNVAAWDRSADLVDRIKYYLARPEERDSIRAEAQRHCLAHHTWERRFSSLLDELGIAA